MGKNFITKIGLERIYRLFELAEKEFAKHPERSNRYVEIAWQISLHNKVKIPAELKTKFCRKCRSFLVKGKNCELKKEENFLVLKCANCGYVRKIPIPKTTKINHRLERNRTSQ